MLKIVIFDSGYGGENFANHLESELPTTEIIRVIDWRSADKTLCSSRYARILAEKALRPFIGKVDLIIVANYLVSITSLRHFRRKYKNQRFIGFTLKPRRIVPGRPTLILTTKAITKSFAYFNFILHANTKTICLDHWPSLIDNGELTKQNLENDLKIAIEKIKNFTPKQVLLACSNFTELKPELRDFFGHNIRIVDSFEDAVEETYKALKLRGRPVKKHMV